ncbi:Chromodomain-helicase-DNA-binding protein 2 [Echinococcus granulosus]|nr:Chromodomain-helicase-DNA-binding protein 2 [Echinococcus granulosus]
MVDESRHQQRRYGRLSESSSGWQAFWGTGALLASSLYCYVLGIVLQWEWASNMGQLSDDADDIPNQVESFGQNSYGCKPEKSRKQNIRELRDDFDYDPELYGIRRSERGRKATRLEVDHDDSSGSQSPVGRGSDPSESESEEDESSSESSSDRRPYRVNQTSRFSGRTRGCRVNYTSAFKDASESEDEASYRPQNGSSTDNRTHRGPAAASLNRNQHALPQKPRGPLIRMSGKAPERYFNPEVAKQADTSDAESYAPHHGQSSNESSVEDPRPVQVAYTADEAVQQEVDVIEEVLSQAVRRIGATGNSTTLYNSRLEKDPNEGFDPAKEKGEIQYLIKWRSWSHIHSTWETEASLTSPDRGFPVDGMKRLYAYQSMIEERKAHEEVASRDELEAMLYEDERNELILSEKMEVDRIVAHSRDKKKGTVDYLCKWRRLDYRFCTWECGQVIDYLFPEAIEAYHRRCSSTTLPNSRNVALTDRPRFARILEQPSYIGGGSPDLQLRDYQLKGLNWIAHAWTRGNSVILADEMGLGKTVQAVSFLSYLFHEYGIYGPFLIVVPLSTISSWQKEIELWSPGLNLVVYVGDHISRQFIREHEWSRAAGVGGRRQQMLKFNICMTTYEILLKDRSWLGQVSWAALVVDEAHRLKNDASQLYKALFAFDTNTRLLITGTPLQNSLKELWSLLHFLMPRHFDDWEEFEDNYSLQGQASSSAGYEAITRLHRTIEPFLLRRVKKDVEQSLPAKTERILRVEMSKKQATLYRLILTRNYDGLMKVTHGHKTSFINIMMELKKCCNHANLIAPLAGEDQFQSNGEALRDLIRGSGKLMLLDKLLQRLRPQGHRVLIFSQMVRMLDIIAEYLQFRGWGFQRLDGSIRGELRKQALDHFNADGSTDFCFLLSTRAGGLGINLATADTVVIFDSDWNPQNDIQAQARAHRIGQTKQVSVYRLVVKDSVEEKIIESATRKMLLDHLVIQRMDSAGNRGGGSARKSDAKGQILTEILRHGAESIFKQNDEETAEVEVDIDDILNRAETRDADVEEDPYNPANVLLSTFNVVTFDQSEQEDAKPVHIDSSGKSAKSWSEIIPEEMRENLKQAESQEALLDLELGPRRRKQVRTFQAGLDNDNYSSSSPSGSDRNGKRLIRLSDKEVRALVRAMKRFARPLERIEAIAAEAELPSRTNDEVREVVETIINGCKAAIESAPEEEDNLKQKGPMYYYGKVAIASKTLLLSLSHLEILHKVLPKTSKEDRLNYDLPFPTRDVNWSTPWSSTDDAHLLVGVYEHGYDNWEAIKLDSDLGLGSKLLPLAANERPQASHVRARVEYLLKALKKHCAKDSCEDSQKGALRRRHNKSSKEHKKKHSKRLSGYAHSKESSRSSVKPKSAEFVESDDSSSGSDGGAGDADAPSISAVPPLRIKKTPQKRHLKIENVDDRPPKKKAKLNDEKMKHEPLHCTSNRNPTSFTKQEEEEFRQMRGSLFLKCKQHLHPIKKLFKQLEHLENHGITEGEKFNMVILGIGEHIRSLVGDIDDREERHTWRHLYWEFVQNFSEKDALQLEQAYSVARKSEWLKQEASSSRSYERNRDEQDRKAHDHRHHRHRQRTQEGQHSQHRDDPIGGRDGSKSTDRHRSRSHHRHGGDAVRTENLNASSGVVGGSGSGSGTVHRSSSSGTVDKRYGGDWSNRRNFNNTTERSLKHRINRNDWSGSSGNLKTDRYNNAFNRPSPGFSDAFNNPSMHNLHGSREHNLNSTSSSIPPPYSFQPPSSQFSWQEQKSAPLLSSPPSMSGSSIIPPPIVSPPSSSSSRDPRLFQNRQDFVVMMRMTIVFSRVIPLTPATTACHSRHHHIMSFFTDY